MSEPIPPPLILDIEEYESRPERYLPLRRKDDRRLPGIITGWAVPFSERYFRWRVWDGTVDREDHHDKEVIWGYWESYGTLEYIEANSAICIPYPQGKPESEFVEWANAQSDIDWNARFDMQMPLNPTPPL